MFYDFVIQNNCPISGTSGWVGLAEALGVQQSGGDWGSGVRSGEAGLKVLPNIQPAAVPPHQGPESGDRCSTVQGIKYEPQLLAEGEARLLQLETSGSQCFYNYLRQMYLWEDGAFEQPLPVAAPVSSQGPHPLAQGFQTPTIQVTCLPSSQKGKCPKHFPELKSFKDNYNTLESTL
uniref:Uncharacterized protein n=1 Tax=Crocodylus porosus TaxID=8502 RepID=A0A7M4E8S0_CROPO